MIKVIVAGHGQYASGLYSSVKLLFGEVEQLEIIDFQQGDSFEDLCETMEKYSKVDEEVLILTDIPGGSPAKAAVMTAFKVDNVRVLTGVNLPLLLECVIQKDICEDISALCTKILDSAKDAITEIKIKK